MGGKFLENSSCGATADRAVMSMSGTGCHWSWGQVSWQAGSKEHFSGKSISCFAQAPPSASATRTSSVQFATGVTKRRSRPCWTRHGPMVLSSMPRRCRTRGDAEDAFQATFLVLIRRAGSIKQPRLIEPLAVRGRRSRCTPGTALAARRVQRERTGVISESADVEHEGQAGRSAEQDELRAVLDQEINRLPEMLRLPVVLCHVEGLHPARSGRAAPDNAGQRPRPAGPGAQKRFDRG